MIYKKNPRPLVEPMDWDEFIQPGYSSDSNTVRLSWVKAVNGVEAKVQEVFTYNGKLLGTMIFVWSLGKEEVGLK